MPGKETLKKQVTVLHLIIALLPIAIAVISPIWVFALRVDRLESYRTQDEIDKIACMRKEDEIEKNDRAQDRLIERMSTNIQWIVDEMKGQH